MQKITFNEYIALSTDRKHRETFKAYSNVERGEGGFDFRIVPNPDLVIMTEEEQRLENAMQIGNGAERAARMLAFQLDRIFRPHKPVLVAEGDSWLQFPILVDEIVDHLAEEFAILSLAAAGDTADNMVHGDLEPGGSEYLTNLRSQKEHVRAFLFSAAGNDIIGEDRVTKKSALFDIINDFSGDENDVAGHINDQVLTERLGKLRAAYEKVISDIRGEPGLERLPIIIHGYDYAFPFPHVENDPRNPLHAKNNEWLGEPLDRRRFPVATQQQRDLRRAIVALLIDRLYDMLADVAGDPASTRVWVVNCRDAMPDVSDWIDEIHGTTAGFAKVTERVRQLLDGVLASG